MSICGQAIPRIVLAVSCFALALSLTSCGGAAGGTSAINSASKSVVTVASVADMALLHAVYFNQRTPAGFYKILVPAAAQSSGSYRLSHLKDTDILPPADRINKLVYALSTNDFVQAMNWSETAVKYQKTYRQFVNITATDLYFQITRVDMNNPGMLYYDRIFKSSAFDRSGVNLSAAKNTQSTVYMGTIPPATLSLARVKQIIEYLWSFSTSNNFGYAIISTSIVGKANAIVYRMEEARLALSYSASCDVVSLYAMDYSVDRLTGKINRTTTLVRQLSARRHAAQISLCP